MAEAVYLLCAIFSIVCTVLLFRGYRATKSPLLLRSCICFGFLAVSNLALVADLILFPAVNLSLWRTGIALTGMLALVVGLCTEGG